jgi:hypothetical protein
MEVYVYQAALLCASCGKAAQARLLPGMDCRHRLEDSDSYPQGPYGNGGGEADTPQHCDDCGVFLENPLTKDGQTYVKQAVARGKGKCLDEWRDFYSDLFE